MKAFGQTLSAHLESPVNKHSLENVQNLAVACEDECAMTFIPEPLEELEEEGHLPSLRNEGFIRDALNARRCRLIVAISLSVLDRHRTAF